ncbi:MAG TPA: hypothetical protein VE620_02505 [Myxococcales bacterium]|nr:hypothetical protein [Myxococcales bacterium]
MRLLVLGATGAIGRPAVGEAASPASAPARRKGTGGIEEAEQNRYVRQAVFIGHE